MTVKAPHAFGYSKTGDDEGEENDSDAEDGGGGGWESDAEGGAPPPSNGHGRRMGVSTQARHCSILLRCCAVEVTATMRRPFCIPLPAACSC